MRYWFLRSRFALLSDTPFGILADSDRISDARGFIVKTGIPSLGQVLNVAGIISAAVIILAALGMLLIVNYPKTVAQTKEKIANALMVVAFIAAFPLIADALYTVITESFY